MTLTIKFTTSTHDYYDTDPTVTLPFELIDPNIKNTTKYEPLLIHLDTLN